MKKNSMVSSKCIVSTDNMQPEAHEEFQLICHYRLQDGCCVDVNLFGSVHILSL